MAPGMPDHAPGESQKDWIRDFTHENGQYVCRCVYCEALFYGHKRRVVCQQCTTTERAGASRS